jgi:hypothetical protein
MTHIELYNDWKLNNPEEYSLMSTDQKREKMREFKRQYSKDVGGAQYMDIAEQVKSPTTTDINGLKVSLPRNKTAKEKFEEYKSIPAGERREFMGMNVPGAITETMETLYPRTTKSQVSGEGIGPASLVSDAMSAPITGYVEGGMSLADLAGTGIDKSKVREGMPYKMATDPSMIPSMLSGGSAGLLSKSLSPASMIGAKGTLGAMSQAPMSYMEQMSQKEMGNEFDQSQAASETAVAGAISSFLPIIGATAKEVGKQVKKGISGVTGLEVETLQKVNLDPIKEKLSRAFKSEGDRVNPENILTKMNQAKKESTTLARNLINEVDNFEKIYMTENPVVNEAVENMGSTSVVPMLKKLDSMKKSAVIGNKLNKNTLKYNKEISELMSQIQSGGPEVSYRDMLRFRRDLDDGINYKRFSSSNPALASNLQGLHKEFADFMRGELVDGAKKTGNVQYITGMKGMADKYDKYDNLKELLGGGTNKIQKVTRANKLMSTLENESSEVKKEALENVSDLIGNKYLDHAEMLDIANKWGKALRATGGDSRILSGASKLGSVPQFGAGTVGAIDIANKGYESLADLANQYKSPSIGSSREEDGYGTVLRGE